MDVEDALCELVLASPFLPKQKESVPYVSVTMCYLCLRPPMRSRKYESMWFRVQLAANLCEIFARQRMIWVKCQRSL